MLLGKVKCDVSPNLFNLITLLNQKNFSGILYQQPKEVAKKVGRKRVAPFKLCLLCFG